MDMNTNAIKLLVNIVYLTKSPFSRVHKGAYVATMSLMVYIMQMRHCKDSVLNSRHVSP